MLDIRVAGLADAEALALLGAASMLETYAELVDGADILADCRTRHAAAVYEGWLADPSVDTWIASTARGVPVGYLVLMPARASLRSATGNSRWSGPLRSPRHGLSAPADLRMKAAFT